MRKNLLTEIKELRKQVLLVQLQSMKVMQQTIHSVFKTQTSKTSEQIAQQNTELQKQLEAETEIVTPTSTNDPATAAENIISDEAKAFNDIVLNALKIAQQSVDNAMQSTQSIMTEAKNLLTNF